MIGLCFLYVYINVLASFIAGDMKGLCFFVFITLASFIAGQLKGLCLHMYNLFKRFSQFHCWLCDRSVFFGCII